MGYWSSGQLVHWALGYWSTACDHVGMTGYQAVRVLVLMWRSAGRVIEGRQLQITGQEVAPVPVMHILLSTNLLKAQLVERWYFQ